MESTINNNQARTVQVSLVPSDYLERLEQKLTHIESYLREKGGKGNDGDELLTGPEVCDMLGIKNSTLYKMRKEGLLPSVSVGKLIRIRKSDVEKYMESNRVNG